MTQWNTAVRRCVWTRRSVSVTVSVFNHCVLESVQYYSLQYSSVRSSQPSDMSQRRTHNAPTTDRNL